MNDSSVKKFVSVTSHVEGFIATMEIAIVSAKSLAGFMAASNETEKYLHVIIFNGSENECDIQRM